MPKRRKEDSDIEESEFEGGSQGSDSDASFSTGKQKNRVRARKQGPPKRKKPASDTILPDIGGTLLAPRHPQSTHVVQNGDKVRKALLTWYNDIRESRGMPWRKPFNPAHTRTERAQRAYEVWVSEIMLQQTQVATVIPYYNRWMAKQVPNYHRSRDIEQVNALWKGLGYYSRASRLLAGAQKVVRELEGLLPDNAKDMEAKIPGIGRYSAGAICSIAYGEKVPVLDGNVHRLMSRFLMLYANPKSKATLDILWTSAEAMVDVQGSSDNADYQNPGDINQALIELGSTICKVQNPTCSSCPLREWCVAYLKQTAVKGQKASQELGDIEDLCSLCEPLPLAFDVVMLPMKVEKKKAREETDIVNVVEWRSAAESPGRWFLLVKRPEKGLLAGLYEFPTLGNVSEAVSKQPLTAVMDLLSNLLGTPIAARSLNGGGLTDSEVRMSQVSPAGDILHLFSHVKKTYRSQWVVLEGGGVSPPMLAAQAKVDPPRKKGGKGKRKAEEFTGETVGGRTASSEEMRWIAFEEVDEQNISTGMVKVWNLVQSLWCVA